MREMGRGTDDMRGPRGAAWLRVALVVGGLALALGGAGCGDSTEGGAGSGAGVDGGGVGFDIATPDTGDGTDTGSPLVDVGPTTPLDVPPPDPGEVGAPCQANNECHSGYCVEGPDGYVCSKQCEDECPTGWDCKGVQSGSQDLVFLCLPRLQPTCTPCTEDAQCKGGACLGLAADGTPTGPDGGRCAPACESDADCPDAYTCALDPSAAHDGSFCQPKTGSCTCNGEVDGGQRTCALTNGAGTCFGVETCDPTAGWSACSAQTPEPEACDGFDNDCNGLIDDGLAEGEPCANTVEGVGSCEGLRYCQGSQGWVCQAPTPEVEVCDYKDNDCDGEVDEDFKQGDLYAHFDHCGACNTSCAVGFPNAAGTECSVTTGAPQCVVAGCLPGFTKVNEFQCVAEGASLCQPCADDGDCVGDGAACVDVGDGQYCGKACQGADDCPPGYGCHSIPGVAQKQCTPSTASCTCNAGSAGLSRACQKVWTSPDPSLPSYTCAGLEYCTASGWGSCELPVEECDGLDNDCDGAIDEDFKDAEGAYAQDDNCGACGVSCQALNPPNASSACVKPAGGTPSCSYTCVGSWVDVDGLSDNGCECLPVAGPDLPDPQGTDSDCDGIDGSLDQAVFVAKWGDDAAPGTFEQPKRSVQAGIDAADALGKRDVLVATGVYVESIALADGVDLYGGYSADFLQRDIDAYQTAIMGQAASEALPGAVNALGVGQTGTIFDGFSVFGEDANEPGASSYAIYLRNVGPQLQITHNQIFAGDGAPGANGVAGASGDNGGDGEPGVDATNVGATCGTADEASGGWGGLNTCGADFTWTDGGAGGRRVCPEAPSDVWNGAQVSLPEEFGEDGYNDVGGDGAGGEAGWDGLTGAGSNSCGICSSSKTHASDGADGLPGSMGVDGAAAAPCASSGGVIVDGRWVPPCLLYTPDAADQAESVALGGRRASNTKRAGR